MRHLIVTKFESKYLTFQTIFSPAKTSNLRTDLKNEIYLPKKELYSFDSFQFRLCTRRPKCEDIESTDTDNQMEKPINKNWIVVE